MLVIGTVFVNLVAIACGRRLVSQRPWTNRKLLRPDLSSQLGRLHKWERKAQQHLVRPPEDTLLATVLNLSIYLLSTGFYDSLSEDDGKYEDVVDDRSVSRLRALRFRGGRSDLDESWVGLESNPEVMTQYAHKLGMSNDWEFSDCWGLDEEALSQVPQPCVGCVFLYPFGQIEARKHALGANRGRAEPGVWHMRQVIGNACGAVAIMHVVMNSIDQVGADSPFLADFRGSTVHKSTSEKGKMFQESARAVHRDIAPQGQTDAPQPAADLDFHFIALVEVNGRMYELDGNNEGPIDCGPVSPQGLLYSAAVHCRREYIDPFPDSHFSLITLGPKRLK